MTTRIYHLALLIHILGTMALFIGFAMLQRVGSRLRKSTTFAEARPYADLLYASRPIIPSGAIMVLLTGVFMAMKLGTSQLGAWIEGGVVIALAIGTIALAVVVRGIAAIFTSLQSGEGALTGEAMGLIRRPLLWSAAGAANGAALGAIWLMTMRPAAIETSLFVALPILLGAVVGARIAKG